MKGKVAIVTGASSGIGLSCAEVFASQGASVVLAARRIDKLKIIESALTKMGYTVYAIKTDVTIEEDCNNLITMTVKKYGKIDYLINNAGVSMRAMLLDLDVKVVRRIMEVNFFGTVYCTKYALPYIIDSNGSIVGITSLAGFFGLPARSGYSASKFALQGFLETIRVENLHKNIHVMIVAPGFTATNIRKNALTANGTPQGISPRDENKMVSSREVALKITNGIFRHKRTLIMSREDYLSIIVRRLAPSLFDRILYYYMAKEPNSYQEISENNLIKNFLHGWL